MSGRIRSIKPEMFTDVTVCKWSPLTRWIYLAILAHADDAGRFKADITSIKNACAPFDSMKAVAAAFRPLVESNKILLYEARGEECGVVVNFWHQKIDRPSRATTACPPEEICNRILETARTNPRCCIEYRARLSRMLDGCSPSVRRSIAEWMPNHSLPLGESSPLEQGSKGAREEEQGLPLPPEGGEREGCQEWFLERFRKVSGGEAVTVEQWRRVLENWSGWTLQHLVALLDEAEAMPAREYGPKIGNPVVWLRNRLGALVSPYEKNRARPVAVEDEPVRKAFQQGDEP